MVRRVTGRCSLYTIKNTAEKVLCTSDLLLDRMVWILHLNRVFLYAGNRHARCSQPDSQLRSVHVDQIRQFIHFAGKIILHEIGFWWLRWLRIFLMINRNTHHEIQMHKRLRTNLTPNNFATLFNGKLFVLWA